MAAHRRGPRHARTREGIALSAVIAAVATVIALSVAPNQGGANAATGPVTGVTAGSVVYVNELNGANEIDIRTSDGSVTDLTPSGQIAMSPAVSPDGSRIAFAARGTCVDYPSYTGIGLKVMNSDGSNQVWITEPHCHSDGREVEDTNPVWSPDGTKLAYVHEDGGAYNIYKVNVDGTGVTPLTTNGMGYDTPSWSPDGTRLVYDMLSGSNDYLYIMDADGTSIHQVSSTPNSYEESTPKWAPSGNRIYFVSSGGMFGNFWYYDSSDGFASEESLTAQSVSGATNPVAAEYDVSADGNTLVYRGDDGGSIGGCNELWTLDVSSSTATQVTHDTCSGDWGANYVAPTYVKASWPPPPAFAVKVDDSSVGKVFGSVTGKKVLDSQILHPITSCQSGWEVSTTNNTDFVLHAPTNGNVSASRVDVGQSGSSYLVPGQTGSFCVGFTQLNQVFDVLYDISDPLARAADAALFLADVLGFPSGDSTDLANFISSVASIPAMQRIGACLGSSNPFCAPQAINALMTNTQSRNELVGDLLDYATALGKSVTVTWLEAHLRQHLVKVFTSGWWTAKFIGQVLISPTGYVAFETVPGAGGGGGGGGF
jgi:hypothetical protein